MTEFFVRSYPLEDIAITKGGDGRTVEAYAAVFKRAAEIRDQDGHYLEEIDPTAFNRTIANRRNKFGVFYNHGLTIHGTPSDRGSVPIGTPQEVRVDNVGVRTVTRYNRTALADEVLEAINSGAITAQSFTGRFLRSNPVRVPRKGTAGKLPTVTRMEIDMREYGPTPFPAYAEAMITGVRAMLGQGGSADLGLWAALAGDLVDPHGLRALATQDEDLHSALQEAITAGTVRDVIGDLVSSGRLRGSLPADELTGSRGQDTPPQADPSRQDTPPRSDSSAGDPAPTGSHSARLARMKHNARKTVMREVAGRARTQEKRSPQGEPGGVQG